MFEKILLLNNKCLSFTAFVKYDEEVMFINTKTNKLSALFLSGLSVIGLTAGATNAHADSASLTKQRDQVQTNLDNEKQDVVHFQQVKDQKADAIKKLKDSKADGKDDKQSQDSSKKIDKQINDNQYDLNQAKKTIDKKNDGIKDLNKQKENLNDSIDQAKAAETKQNNRETTAKNDTNSGQYNSNNVKTDKVGGYQVQRVNKKVDKAVDFSVNAANKKIPYVWGGTNAKKGMDCSGLTLSAYGKTHTKLPRVSQEQAKVGKPVNNKNLRAGD